MKMSFMFRFIILGYVLESCGLWLCVSFNKIRSRNLDKFGMGP